jgi:hypothetical protein
VNSVPGLFWTVHWIQGGDKGKDVVIAPTRAEAMCKWLMGDRPEDRFFTVVERTQLANSAA